MTLLEDLRETISVYLNRSKGHSLRSLSLRAGVPYSTLYKIYSGEIENPQLDTVMKLVREGLEAKSDRRNFIRKHYAYMYELMDFSDVDVKEPLLKRQNDPEIDALFKERDAFFLLYHLFAKCGISNEEVKESYGDHGLALLKDMAARDYVDCQDGLWKIKFDYDFSTLEVCKVHIINAISGFRQESAAQGCGLMHTMSEGVSLQGARDITLEMSDCLERLRLIRDQNPGRHVFIANFAMQVLNPSFAERERGLV